MRKIIILNIFLFISLLFLIGCTQKVICNEPYILVGTDCCLDKNINTICDKDESVPEEILSSDCENPVLTENADIPHGHYKKWECGGEYYNSETTCDEGYYSESPGGAFGCFKESTKDFGNYKLKLDSIKPYSSESIFPGNELVTKIIDTRNGQEIPLSVICPAEQDCKIELRFTRDLYTNSDAYSVKFLMRAGSITGLYYPCDERGNCLEDIREGTDLVFFDIKIAEVAPTSGYLSAIDNTAGTTLNDLIE